MSDRPTIVDLFCGCGGFGLGAELAGFEAVAAVDIDETLQSAYRYNFPNTQVLNGDLSTMGEEAWRLILRDKKIDGVIGGPPCQGYSRIGSGDVNDPRRSLLFDFYRTINIIQPSFFVMENVEGLLDKGNGEVLTAAIDTLDSRYTVLKPLVVDASDYGAPTKRKRVIVVGYDASRIEHLTEKDLLPKRTVSVTVEDAIADLPNPLPMNSSQDEFGWKKYRSTQTLSAYSKKMRRTPTRKSGLGNKEAIDLLKSGLTSGHFNTVHTESVIKRFSKTSPGTTDSISRAKRLAWDGLCPTLRAGTGSDRGSYQSVRPIHPGQPRVITVREAARLQGFPDWFCFHPAKWHSFRMIGNSVSPVVSQKILANIKIRLKRQIPKKVSSG